MSQIIARLCSPAIQNPLAALKHRIALVHPLTQAPGLLSIFRTLMSLKASLPFWELARAVTPLRKGGLALNKSIASMVGR
jgi:hypothetical protein